MVMAELVYHNIADVKDPEDEQSNPYSSSGNRTRSVDSADFCLYPGTIKLLWYLILLTQTRKRYAYELASNVDEALAMAFKIKGNDAKLLLFWMV